MSFKTIASFLIFYLDYLSTDVTGVLKPTKVKRGGREEIPLIQGKEQRLRSAGAAEIPHVQGKRNPSKTVGVARGHQRADTLKP